MLREEEFMSVLTIVMILAAAIVVTLTEFGSFGTTKGQENRPAQQPQEEKMSFSPKLVCPKTYQT